MLNFENKLIHNNILIYGFGKSGKACFGYLKKNNHIKIYDDNLSSIPKNLKSYIATKRNLDNYDFNIIILSPGIDINNCGIKSYLMKNSQRVISELDIFYLNNPNNFKITITGTNGKSTTSKLIYEVLKKHGKDVRLVGNIGNPLLLEKKINNNTIFVIEASSYQIEYSKYFKTNFSVILNIAPDHLERHKSIKKYVQSKFKLINNQSKKDFAFIEKNNFYFEKELKRNKIFPKVYKVNSKIEKKYLKKIKNSYFETINNKKNLKFVIEISKKLKLNINKVFSAVNNFKGLNYRQQIIYKNKKLMIINDSKSTSFSSSKNLLQSYKNIYWIVGGLAKKGDVFRLNKKYYKNIIAYVYGKNKNFFLDNFRNKINSKKFKNLKKAMNQIILDAKNHNSYPKNIIFSPSAASFDQFENFEKRGQYFNNLIKKNKIIKKLNV